MGERLGSGGASVRHADGAKVTGEDRGKLQGENPRSISPLEALPRGVELKVSHFELGERSGEVAVHMAVAQDPSGDQPMPPPPQILADRVANATTLPGDGKVQLLREIFNTAQEKECDSLADLGLENVGVEVFIDLFDAALAGGDAELVGKCTQFAYTYLPFEQLSDKWKNEILVSLKGAFDNPDTPMQDKIEALNGLEKNNGRPFSDETIQSIVGKLGGSLAVPNSLYSHEINKWNVHLLSDSEKVKLLLSGYCSDRTKTAEDRLKSQLGGLFISKKEVLVNLFNALELELNSKKEELNELMGHAEEFDPSEFSSLAKSLEGEIEKLGKINQVCTNSVKEYFFFDKQMPSSLQDAFFEKINQVSFEEKVIRVNAVEKENGPFDGETIQLMGSKVSGKPTALDQCARWNIDRINGEEAYRILMQDTVGVAAMHNIRYDVLEKMVQKLQPAEAERFARALYHSCDEGKKLAETLFKDGVLNLSQEIFNGIKSEVPPVFERKWCEVNGERADRVIEAAAQGTVYPGVGALRVEFENVVREATNALPSPTTLPASKNAWQSIANEVARCCFNEDMKVDVEKVLELRLAIQTAKLDQEPLSKLPSADLMVDQTLSILDDLLYEKSDLREVLDSESGLNPNEQGKDLLRIMSQGKDPQLKPAEAILASLFPPHRQYSLPTCTIDSLINAETLNIPARLAVMYAWTLDSDTIPLPGGYLIHQQSLEIESDGTKGKVTIDLTNGGKGRDDVFKKFEKIDAAIAKIDAAIAEKNAAIAKSEQGTRRDDLIKQKNDFESKKQKIIEILEEQRHLEGIEYDPSDPYKLSLQIQNLTDALFANLFQETFGKESVNSKDRHGYGIDLIWNGIPLEMETPGGIFSPIISLDADGRKGFDLVKAYAQFWKEKGCKCMGISTTTPGAGEHSSHSENVYTYKFSGIGLYAMKSGDNHPIGDRNWANKGGECVPLRIFCEDGNLKLGSIEDDGVTKRFVSSIRVNIARMPDMIS